MADGLPEVWIADDTPLDAERARRILAEHYVVTTFQDGSEVLERLNQPGKPAVLVLDWVMPGVSGLDVCRFLRTTHEEIPVLLLTAHGDTEQLVEGLAAGASDYLSKPYADAELLARVGALVRSRNLLIRARAAEATIARLLAVSPDPLFALDDAGVVTYANPQAQIAFECDLSQILGQPLSAFLPDLDVHPQRDTPVDVKVGDQTYSASIRRSETTSAVAAVSLRNVTRRRLEEARRLDLYSVVAHDLRSPLSAMLMRTEVILAGKRGLLSADLAADLRKMQHNIRELVAMINDFLELARYEGGGYKLEYARMDLCDVLRQTTDDFRPLSDASKVQLRLEDPHCSVMVIGDQRRLNQAVSNLISNGIKFTPPGGSVTIRSEVDPHQVTTFVEDTGEGIDPVAARGLFQRYQRGQGAGTGTGLGLMIVREIIELHSGTVGVESTPGQGSSFWFRLPRATPLKASA